MAQNATDVRMLLDEAPMGRVQIAAIALCVLLNALDGFDVLAISFASPGIAAEWGVERAALGLVLSMELIGMAVGSMAIGRLADRIGRRPSILLCLVVMAAGMLLATQAVSVVTLSLIRLCTGLGIGGMLACTNAMVAELANARSRNLAVTIMAAGYPVGAVLGGSIASMLLVSGGWRDVFLFGGVATALVLPLAWAILPESIGFLLEKRPTGVLDKVNRTLARMGHATVAALPVPGVAASAGFASLLQGGLARVTLLLTASYFMHIMTFYFILKWTPKIVVDMGYAPSAAGGVLVWTNVGGLFGSLLLGALSWRMNIRWLVIGAMLASTVMIALFGRAESTTLSGLSLIAAIAGFCTNAAVVGLYAIIAQSFPTTLRATGTGIVIGVGRGGAALGPIIAGLLFSLNFGLQGVAIGMAAGSAIAALALFALRDRSAV